MFKKLAAILLLVPALAAATTTASAGPSAQWLQFRYGPSRVGFNPNETTLTTANVGSVVRGWNTRLPAAENDLIASPVLSGSTIYFAGSNLIAVNTANGHVKWQVSPAGAAFPQTEATPAIDGNDLFVAWEVSGTSGVVQERSAATGSLLWSRTVPSANFTSGPATLGVRNGLVYFTVDTANEQWTLYALAESTGAIAWSDSFTGSFPFTPPAVNASVLVIGLSTNSVVAVNPMTGAHLWSAATTDQMYGIAIGGTTAYVVGACFVDALSTSSGGHIFTTTPAGCTAVEYYPPAIAYGEVYVASSDGHLYAINAATGAITWTAASSGNGAPSVANHVVYRCNETLQAFDASTGTNLLSVAPERGSITDVDIAGGRIYIAHFGPKSSTYASMYKLP